MIYLGSKRRYSKEILSLIPNCHTLVEPFVGGGNFTQNIPKGKFNHIIINDINPYLIAYFHALKTDWEPQRFYSEQQYKDMQQDLKNNTGKYPPHELAYVGFMISFNARFFQGYARAKTHNRNYSHQAYGHFLKDKEYFSNTHNITILNTSYNNIPLPINAVVYCDPPYHNAKQYHKTPTFDHNQFYQWIYQHLHTNLFFISEQQAPDDFIPIWNAKRTSWGHNFHDTKIEKLFVHQSQLPLLSLPQKIQQNLF